jgi:small conductance mechanosensitive channel
MMDIAEAVGEHSGAGLAWRTLAGLWESFLERLPLIVIGLIVLALFVVAGRIVKRIIVAAGRRTRLHETLAALLGRLASAAMIVLGLFVSAVVIFPAFKPGDLVAGLGITSIAVGFAFKDILQNFLAGLLLLWRQPFRIGDQVRTGETEGTVEEINTRSTRIKTYDGELVTVPNMEVYSRAILVRTAFGIRRSRFTVGIGYPDSIEQARETIEGVLRDTDGVLREPAPWVHVTELAPSSVNFTVSLIRDIMDGIRR